MVVFVYPGDLSPMGLAETAGSGRLRDLARVAELAGFEAVIVSECEYASPSRWKRALYLAGRVRKLEGGAELVLFYGTSLFYTLPLLLFCRREGIKLGAIVNEWGDRDGVSWSRFAFQRLGIRFVRRWYDGLVAISSFMRADFEGRGRPVVVVPSVFDRSVFPDVHVSEFPGDTVRLAYAGSPGNKDELGTVVEAVGIVNAESPGSFTLSVFGLTSTEYMKNFGDGPIPASVKFHGFVPRPDLRRSLSAHDYSVILRKDREFLVAAFPTKFGESFMLGVPVIATPVGDMADYLSDGLTGFVVREPSVEELIATLKRVLERHASCAAEMRAEVHRVAARSFEVRAYAQAFSEFVHQVVGR